MSPLIALILWSIAGGYVYGKRSGQQVKYAILGAPVALVVFFSLYALLGRFTGL